MLYVQGEPLSGVQSENSLWTVVDRALRSQGINPPARLEHKESTYGD